MMKTKNSIYICGPVSGTDDYIQRFSECEKRLIETFDGSVFNPVKYLQGKYKEPEKIEWGILMLSCLQILTPARNFTNIYLMSGWEKSHGARIEQLWAERLGLIEIREAK